MSTTDKKSLIAQLSHFKSLMDASSLDELAENPSFTSAAPVSATGKRKKPAQGAPKTNPKKKKKRVMTKGGKRKGNCRSREASLSSSDFE